MVPPQQSRDLLKLQETIRRLEARVSELEKALAVSGDTVTLQTGNSSIVLKKTSILIKSDDVTVSGTTRINIKSAGNVTVKGSKILQN